MNMKNNTTEIILSAIVFLSAVGFFGTADAAGSSLYVSPASLTKTVGSTFGASIGVNAFGNKVCAVEGTLVFNNLSCQSITVASDVTPQSSPTCSNPHFLIGVPSCTTVDKVLFTVLAKAGNAGTASISLTGVDMIGEGLSLGSASINGNYAINAVVTPTPKIVIETTSTPKLTPASAPEKKIEITSATTTETTTVTSPKEEEKITVVQPEGQQMGEKSSFLASISSIVTFGTGNALIGILTGLIIFVVVAYAIYAFVQRKKKSSGKI
jgi:hypothetical protein